MRTYRRIYRSSLDPMKVAELMMLRRDVPRSVHHCLWMVDRNMRELAEAYGTRGEADRLAGELHRAPALRAHRPGVRHRPARSSWASVRGDIATLSERNRPPVPSGLSRTMRFSVHHATRFEFDQPSGHSIHDVRLTPKPAAAQRLVSWRIDGPGKRSEWMDGHGNQCHDLLGGAAARQRRDRGAKASTNTAARDQWLRYAEDADPAAPFWLRNTAWRATMRASIR